MLAHDLKRNTVYDTRKIREWEQGSWSYYVYNQGTERNAGTWLFFPVNLYSVKVPNL